MYHLTLLSRTIVFGRLGCNDQDRGKYNRYRCAEFCAMRCQSRILRRIRPCNNDERIVLESSNRTSEDHRLDDHGNDTVSSITVYKTSEDGMNIN
jgi:hypothetical protein